MSLSKEKRLYPVLAEWLAWEKGCQLLALDIQEEALLKAIEKVELPSFAKIVSSGISFRHLGKRWKVDVAGKNRAEVFLAEVKTSGSLDGVFSAILQASIYAKAATAAYIGVPLSDFESMIEEERETISEQLHEFGIGLVLIADTWRACREEIPPSAKKSVPKYDLLYEVTKQFQSPKPDLDRTTAYLIRDWCIFLKNCGGAIQVGEEEQFVKMVESEASLPDPLRYWTAVTYGGKTVEAPKSRLQGTLSACRDLDLIHISLERIELTPLGHYLADSEQDHYLQPSTTNFLRGFLAGLLYPSIGRYVVVAADILRHDDFYEVEGFHYLHNHVCSSDTCRHSMSYYYHSKDWPPNCPRCGSNWIISLSEKIQDKTGEEVDYEPMKFWLNNDLGILRVVSRHPVKVALV